MSASEPRVHARKGDAVGITLCGKSIVFTPFEENDHYNTVYIDYVVAPPRMDEVTCKICLKRGQNGSG
jgi:hypothetical protein